MHSPLTIFCTVWSNQWYIGIGSDKTSEALELPWTISPLALTFIVYCFRYHSFIIPLWTDNWKVHAFSDFTSDSTLCPAGHRHERILPGTQVLYPISSTAYSCFPTTTYNNVFSWSSMIRFTYWKNIQKKSCFWT